VLSCVNVLNLKRNINEKWGRQEVTFHSLVEKVLMNILLEKKSNFAQKLALQ
jgi:hypothetical protein